MRALPRCVLLSGATLLAACAVLRVDVDVYKGPLANHEDVQMEQLAALAVGAKPLLIQLRDRLEWPESVCGGDFVFPDFHVFGYIADEKGRLKDEYARQVNAVLSLYERNDRHDALVSLIAQTAPMFEELNAALARFRTQDQAAARARWDRDLAPKLKPAASGVAAAASDDKTKALRDLREGYLTLLTANDAQARPNHDIVLASERLVGEERSPFQNTSANAVFDKLSDRLVLQEHAKLLFADLGAQTTFVEWASSVAKSFGDVRSKLEALWLRGLDIILTANATPRYRQHPSIIDLTRRTAERLTQALDGLHLVATLQVVPPDTSSGVDALRRRLADRIPGLFEPAKRTDLWDGQKLRATNTPLYDLLSIALVECFQTDPLATAEALRFLHFQCKSREDLQRYEGLSANSQSSIGRRYGLVRGPSGPVTEAASDAADAVDHEQSYLALVELSRDAPKLTDLARAAGGFERGRPKLGVDDLIEKYLEATTPADKNAARTDLLVGLIHFAQKVVYVANNQALLRGLASDEPKQYVLLLQSIGNSLLAQVDEVHQRRAHAEKLADSAEAEAEAIVHRLGMGFEFARPERGATRGRTTQDAAEIYRDLLIHLDAMYLARVRECGDNDDRAKRIAQAIAFARERANTQVYLRPAMAYLRSVYAATSLQSAESIQRDNMLAGQWQRGLGLGGVDADFETRAAIDKQFWQNVNSVRVAGGGDTNYVLAKDDIGNWYVKSYAANPGPIIRSAKNLAMFAAAKGTGSPSLLERLAKTDDPKDQTTAATRSTSARQAELLQQKFSERSKQDLDSVQTLASGLVDRAKVAWAGRAQDLNDPQIRALAAAIAEDDRAGGILAAIANADDPREHHGTKAESPDHWVVEDLRNLLRLRVRVGAVVLAFDGTGDSALTPVQKRAAIDAFDRLVFDGVRRIATDRRLAVSVFRQSIGVVVESLKPAAK